MSLTKFHLRTSPLALLLILFLVASCEKNCNCPEPCITQLTINNYNDEYNIKAVYLVGYDFSPIYIGQGESQTFNLTDGPVGGTDDILITASFDRPGIMHLEQTIDLVECGRATASFY